MNKPQFYTLGYTGRKPQDLVNLLASKPNSLLIDARFAPRSRVPYWNKGPLAERIGQQYVHVPNWGNANYKNGGPIKLVDFSKGLAQVLQSEPAHVFVLCACKDPAECHRTVIAKKLLAQGYAVTEWSGLIQSPPKAKKSLGPLFGDSE